MDKLTKLQLKLREVGCPMCLHTKLDLSLRCEPGMEECLYVATCQHCHYMFEVNTQTKTLAEMEEQWEGKLKEKGCPKCGRDNMELNFRCDLHSKECFHVGTCQNCGQVFVVGTVANEIFVSERWHLSGTQ
ncbi:MAG: hypothetical protein ACE5OR_16765 [bacterium]